MSKCREAFETHFAGFDLSREQLGNELAPFYYKFETQESWEDWQAAWDAAIARAAEICNEIAKDGEGLAGEVWAERCAIAIERESEK